MRDSLGKMGPNKCIVLHLKKTQTKVESLAILHLGFYINHSNFVPFHIKKYVPF